MLSEFITLLRITLTKNLKMNIVGSVLINITASTLRLFHLKKLWGLENNLEFGLWWGGGGGVR